MEIFMEQIIEKWEEILRTVKEEHELTDISFKTWLEPLKVFDVKDNTLYILVPDEQMGLNYITKKYKDFQNVYRNGKSYADKYLVMYVLENGLESNRIGISVSKKVGNSVVRHHLTRLLRESYRLHEEMFHSGWDIVVIVRVSAKNEGYHKLKSSLLHLSNLHGII